MSQPARSHKPGRIEPELAQLHEPTIDTFPSRRTVQGQELALAISLAPRSPMVSRPPGQSILVVSLAMQHDLGTLPRPGSDPIDEAGMVG
jgi:hypothetical protein